jgi:hypothetical protein
MLTVSQLDRGDAKRVPPPLMGPFRIPVGPFRVPEGEDEGGGQSYVGPRCVGVRACTAEGPSAPLRVNGCPTPPTLTLPPRVRGEGYFQKALRRNRILRHPP